VHPTPPFGAHRVMMVGFGAFSSSFLGSS